MYRSRALRAEKRKLIARHEKQRVKQLHQMAKMLKKIRQADADAQQNMKDLDSLLDRPESELRHVMEKILGSWWWSFPQTLHRLQRYLHVIQQTLGAPPQAPPDSFEFRL